MNEKNYRVGITRIRIFTESLHGNSWDRRRDNSQTNTNTSYYLANKIRFVLTNRKKIRYWVNMRKHIIRIIRLHRILKSTSKDPRRHSSFA